MRCDLDGTGFFALPPDSVALNAVKTMVATMLPALGSAAPTA